MLHPLVVDLDGSIISTDMLHESALRAFRHHPLDIFRIPLWLFKGKAALKRILASRVTFDPGSLPYNQELLSWLRQQKADGRTLVLCTASDRTIADAVAAHLGIFDEVIASDGFTNLAGKYKAKLLEQRFGHSGFDYVGNSSADLAVWECADRAVVVNASADLTKKVAAVCKVQQIFSRELFGLMTFLNVLRVHQWLKNLLLFVPVVAAHQLMVTDNLATLVLAFFSFSICASSVYIVNDLFDLESDRLHLHKRTRPFASGQVPVWMGVVLAPLLFVASLILGVYVGGNFIAWLLFYFLVTCAYSWGIKRLALLDCVALAMLYTLRIIAGAAAAGLAMSFWLLAFSVFLFLSLAFVKRYAELGLQRLTGKESTYGRGYLTSDAPLIQALGIASGYAAVLVLALYINSDAVVKIYRAPEYIWGAIPIMLFWISWMWLQAHRGNMHDDPLVFAVKDKTSLLCGLAFATVILIGTVGWVW